MKKYKLHREQHLPISAGEAWLFFSDARNLAKITPEEMGFVVLTKLDDQPIYTGMNIDYTVRPLFRIPMHWTTEITNVNAPRRFTDKQLKGPYSLWEHTHTFEPVAGGVKMTDDVVYALPLGWLGRIMHSLIVARKLEQIFDFRARTLINYFGVSKNE